MTWTASNPVSIGDATKKSHYDAVWDNIDMLKVLQVVDTQTGAVGSGAGTIPIDDTIPEKTEGDEYFTLAITPSSATNLLKIDVVFLATADAVGHMTVGLFQDTTTNALAASTHAIRTAGDLCMISFTHWMTAGTTSATTFKVRAGLNNAATTTMNGAAAARLLGGVASSSITISEIRP